MPGRVRAAVRKIVPYWVVAVLVGSFLPGSLKDLIGTRPYISNHPVEWQHRLAHFLTFGLTALLFMLLAERRREEAFLAVAAFLLGCLIEFAQFAVGFALVVEWWDIRDDFLAALGAFAAFEVTRLIMAFRRSRLL